MIVYLCRYSSEGRRDSDDMNEDLAQDEYPRPDYLHKFIEFVVKQLQQPDTPQSDWRLKEAYMQCLSILTDEVPKFKDLKDKMEGVFAQFVLPELKSQWPIRRLRACQLYGNYEDFRYLIADHLKKAVDGVYYNMGAQQPLPVRYTAACSLAKMLRTQSLEVYHMIKPVLSEILQKYLELMSLLDNEYLNDAFHMIIDNFQDDLLPYAYKICEWLNNKYVSLCKAKPGQTATEKDK